MYNINSEFYKVFNDKEFNDFIDRTYLKLEDIKEKRNYDKIKLDVDFIVKKYPVKYEFSAGIFGMAGSGKTTLSNMTNKEILSTDKFLAEIKEKNPTFPAINGKSDIFRKHEYKTITCLILSGLANNKILDFGGGALLQPGLALVSKRVFGNRLINLSIDDNTRIYNLIQDAIILGDKSSRNVVKDSVNDDKTITKEQLDKLREECIGLKKQYKALSNAKAKIAELTKNNTFTKISKICEEFDNANRWRKEIFDGVSKPLSFEEAQKELLINNEGKQCQM